MRKWTATSWSFMCAQKGDNAMYRIMLVDDEENILSSLRRVLAAYDFRELDHPKIEVEVFTSPQEALSRANGTAFDLVISDYRMPAMSGVEFLKAFKQLQPDAVRLILSGQTDLGGLLAAINEAQIYRFISKPWDGYDLVATVAQALQHRDLQLENQRLADMVRVQQGKITRQELELKRLEEETPGITHVKWGPDGSVIIDDE